MPSSVGAILSSSSSPFGRTRARVHPDKAIEALANCRERGVPLFVLGAGVSKNRVPMLSEIAEWLTNRLETCPLPTDFAWLIEHGTALRSGQATRRQAAEFFTLMQRQEHPFQDIWRDFSIRFLSSGLDLGGTQFKGLAFAQPSSAHNTLARLLADREAFVISLNFDGLTRKALTRHSGRGIVAHSDQELHTYFSAASKELAPMLIKIRGDVFYARCGNPVCCLSKDSYPLERLSGHTKDSEMPRCPSCSSAELRLQFDFPGLRVKEEAAYPILSSARRFLGPRISSIVTVGLSGKWDRYILHYLLDLALERHILFVDLNPAPTSFIDDFRRVYYPSLGYYTSSLGSLNPPAYCHVQQKAGPFLLRYKQLYYA